MAIDKKITLVFLGKKENYTLLGVAMRLPLSILALAAYMGTKGYKVQLLDTRTKDFRRHDFSKDICVGISNSFSGIQIESGLELAQYIKSLHPEIPIIWGGNHPSFNPRQTIEHPLVDFVVKGEGEETLYELSEALRNKKSYESIKGIVYKKGNQIIENPDRPFLNLPELPIAAYHMLNIEDYSHIKKYFDYQSSRGCPNRCGFCYSLNFCRARWRSKPAETVIAELTYLFNKYGVEQFMIVDDNFFVNQERVRKICESMIMNKMNVLWHANCRLDYFSRYDIDFLKLLRESGCQQIVFGAESGSQKILDSIKKDITVAQILKAAELCKEANIVAGFSFILGLPGEKKEDVMATLDVYDKIKLINPHAKIVGMSLFTPLPGTVLYEKVVAEGGFKPPSSFEGWAKWHWSTDNDMNWVNKKDRRMLKTISHLVRYKHHENEFYLRNKNPVKRLLFTIFNFPFHMSASYRWKSRKFGFPLEWRIWAMLMYAFFEHW